MVNKKVPRSLVINITEKMNWDKSKAVYEIQKNKK